jgi:hypothetical protein
MIGLAEAAEATMQLPTRGVSAGRGWGRSISCPIQICLPRAQKKSGTLRKATAEWASSRVTARRSDPRTAVRSLAIVLLVPVVIATGGCGRAGKTGVKAGIVQIASISAEGALIAEGVARARTKTTFVRVHGDELSAQAEHEAQKLSDDPVSPALKPPIEKAVKLAADIGGAIDDLRVSPHDPQQAREDEAKLRVWAQQAAALAETL